MWLHGRRPYGYQVRDQRLAVDKAEALVVRRAVRLCLRGWSIARIARLFAQEGIRNRNGSPIMMHNVERLLKNPLYLGRRLVRMAVEDIGLADPQALVVANAAKAREMLGWQPQFPTLEAIIESAWRWHQQNPAGYK